MIEVGAYPTRDYLQWIESSDAFLDSPAWAEVLERGLGARVSYVWDGERRTGHLFASFSRGPASIGYLGFPLALDPDARAAEYCVLPMLEAVRASAYRTDLIRCAMSAHGARTAHAEETDAVMTLESCILDLPGWRADASPQRRRYLSVARRRCADLSRTGAIDAGGAERLYRHAVSRNQGIARYGPRYFDALFAASPRQVDVQVMARSAEPVSMVISVSHGEYGCYLHGGTAPDALGLGAADLLMCAAIGSSQSKGQKRFNFLSSPAAQPGLVRFKEKWGGATRQATTIQLSSGLGGRALKLALSGTQLIRRLQRNATSA